MQLSKEKLFFAFLLLFSLIRFFYKIQDRAMFEYDQEFLALEAKKIIIEGKFTLIGAPTSIGGMFIAPLYSYLAALVMLVFKMSPYVANYLTAFWGLLTIVVIYLVCLDLLGFAPAVFASLTALFSFRFLDAIPPLVQPLALTSLLIFWTTLKGTKNPRYLLLGAFLTGWAFNLHFSALFFPILIFFHLLFTKTKPNAREILFLLMILLVFLFPLFFFELRHQFFMTRNFLDFLRGNTGFKMNLLEGFFEAARISLERLSNLIFVNNFPIEMSLVLIALFFTLKTLWLKDKKIFKAVFVWLFVPIIIFSFYKGHIIPYYFTLQEPILFLIFGLFFTSLWRKKFLKLLVVLFFLIFIKENFTLWFSWQTPRSLKNKIAVLEFIKKHSKDQPIYLSHTMEPGVDGGFTYLEWYLQIKKKDDKNLPTYTLVAPVNWQGIESDYIFGDYGVNLPRTTRKLRM